MSFSARSTRWAQRVGPRRTVAIGSATAAAGMAALTSISSDSSYLFSVLPGISAVGAGMAMTLAPVAVAVFAAAPDAHVGIARGINDAVARVGDLAIVAALPLLAGFGSRGLTDPEAFGAGLGQGLWWCAGLLVCAGVAALGLPGRRDVEQMHRTGMLAAHRSCPLDGPPDGTRGQERRTRLGRPRARAGRRGVTAPRRFGGRSPAVPARSGAVM